MLLIKDILFSFLCHIHTTLDYQHLTIFLEEVYHNQQQLIIIHKQDRQHNIEDNLKYLLKIKHKAVDLTIKLNQSNYININYRPPKPPVPPTENRKWLGKNLDVVCFCLAFENDRLLKENESLKVRIKELELSGGAAAKDL